MEIFVNIKSVCFSGLFADINFVYSIHKNLVIYA